MKLPATLLPLVLVALAANSSFADSDASNGDKKAEKPAAEVVDKLVTTQHTATIQGREVKYTATAGKLVMKSDEGEAKAEIFFVAYTKDGVNDLAGRPLTFAFNGGPGSSSVWLHLGMLGPKRIEIPDDTSPPTPPYELTNNPHSLLDITDLVFIDPVSTGFSRPAEGEDKSQFHGLKEDIRIVGQFVHDYITKHGRWRSPMFLIGESYGGIRGAGLAGHLFDRYRLPLSGIVMVSPAVNFHTLGFGPGNDLPYALFVPSYAATAWYHKALPGDLQQLSLDEVFEQAKEFATTDYTLALMKGYMLGDEERSAVAEKLSRYTGLSKEFVEASNLRISMQRFGKELLRDRGRTVGRYDSRFTGVDADTAGETPEYDPSGSLVFGAFTATINDYLRNELKFDDDRVYEILTGNVRPWNYGPNNRPPDESDTLRRTMAQNPLMKLFVAMGHFDLATPPLTATYSVERMRLTPELQENISYGYYEAGHMMYIYEPAFEQLRQDVAQFYESTLSPVSDE